jgi:EAL domain-containing protein (putative c-di-GMP-specific phosphodiesterase class I)
MREGQQSGSPFAGGAGFAAARSFAHAAEDLVRATGGPALAWEGVTATTVFQPIFCVRRQSCLGFEALVRAQGPDGDCVASEEFFARDHAGGRTLLDWACRALHLRSYASVDPGDRTLFINVHPEAALRDARRGRDLADLIRYYGLAPKRVCIEILEHPCSDEELLREAVQGYRALGMSVAMDDFGVGSSNFDRMIMLRPDVVKIDKSILADAVGNEKAARVLPTMIELLHEFEVRVAVEGIESHAGAAAAIDARADYVQGYFFGGPSGALATELGGRERLDRLLHPPALAAA